MYENFPHKIQKEHKLGRHWEQRNTQESVEKRQEAAEVR